MHTSLLNHIHRYILLSEEEKALVTASLKQRCVKKKEHLWNIGQTCHALAFIVKGCFRLYITQADGSQQTLQFGVENWWIADYVSFGSQKPSLVAIQAIEEAEVLLLDHQVQESLCLRIPGLERYFRKVMQRAYTASQQRIQYLYCLSAEERYANFYKAQPEFVQRVPQYMLASYLGFSPEFLSRIRAKKDPDLS